MARDYGVSAIYRAEKRALPFRDPAYRLTLEEGRWLVSEACAWLISQGLALTKQPPALRLDGKRSRDYTAFFMGSRNEIVFVQGVHLTSPLLLHEIAHWARRFHHSWERAHGPEWQQTYVRLVCEFLSAELGAKLAQAFETEPKRRVSERTTYALEYLRRDADSAWLPVSDKAEAKAIRKTFGPLLRRGELVCANVAGVGAAWVRYRPIARTVYQKT